MPTKQHKRVTSASDEKSRGKDQELIASQHDEEEEKADETEKFEELKKEDEEAKKEGEEEEEINLDSDSEEEVEEDEEEMGGERLIELSSDDDDDDAALKMHARGMLTYVAAEFIPTLRKIDERQCLKMIPRFEKSDRIKYEKHLAEVSGSANLKSIKEVNEGGPKEASSKTSNTTKTKKGKDSSTKAHSGPPYTIEEFYTPLPTLAQERQRFKYVALSVTPRFVKLMCNPDSDFVGTRCILDSIVADAVMKNEKATDAAKKSHIEIESDRFKNPRILNISAKLPAECVVEYGPTRGERPVHFDPFNIWDHFEGGWTRQRLSKHKNQFWTKCYMDNASKAAMFMSLVRRRLGEGKAEDRAAPTPPIGEAELAALEYLAENDPYFHLKLPPFGCRAHRFIFEDPLLDVLMAIPLRKYDLIFAYGALARMGPNEENLGDYSLKQRLTLKAFKDNGFIFGDTPKTGVFGDPKMVVFALDALIPEYEGGDLEIRERAWLADANGFGLVENAHPVIAAFALAASVIYWRLVAIGERHAEGLDSVVAFFNLMRAAAQYDYEEMTLVKKLKKSYARKINKKTGPKSRQVKPESIPTDMFTEADFAPLLNYRNAFVTNMERTRKTLMHELARITNLPNAALWPEEEARLNAIRHWSEAEKERATQPTTSITTRDEQPPCERQRGKKWGAGPWGCPEVAKAKADERLRILNITSEVLWGLSAQRMCQTDAEGREPYLNLEKTLLTDVGNNVNYFGEWVGNPEEQAKSLVQLLPYETRNNIRRWKTPFGDGGVCYSDLFNGLPPSGAYVLSGEGTLMDAAADAAVPLSTKGTTAHIGPFPLDCSFATPHRHILPKKTLRVLRHFLCALNTEGEPHYWAAFGDYLADVRSHDKQAGKAKQAPRPLVSFPIPHPMQIFDVKLTNPVVSLDCLAACDMCSRRNLRMGYEARKNGDCGPRPLADPSLLAAHDAPAATDIYPHLESLASVLPKSLAADAPELHVPKRVVGREHFQFMDDFRQCGFDICVTCAAAMVHEAHVALLSTVGVLKVVAPISPAPDESAAGGVYDGEAKSTAVVEGAHTAPKLSRVAALDDELGQVVSRRVAAESSAGVPEGVIVLEREVRIGTIGSRPSIAINNQLRVARRAKVKLVREGDDGVGGVLHLYLAVSPIGARPIARVWGEGYGDLLVQSALTRAGGGSGVRHDEDDEAAHYPDYAEHPLYVAGQRVVSAAAALQPFLANATRVPTRQLCNFRSKGAEVVAVGEDEDDEECPICLELLNFVGGGAGAGAGPAMRREATVSTAAAGSFETDEACRAADFRGQQLTLPGSQLTRCDSSFSHASSRGGEEGEGTGLEVGGGIAVAKQTSCGHWFHPQCLERFMVNNKTTTCPVCRCPDALESLAVKQMRAVERTRRARRVARTRRLIEDIQATNANTSAVVANAADMTLSPSTVATTKTDENETEGTTEENEEDEENEEGEECEEEEEAEEWSDVDDLSDGEEEEEENGSKSGGEEGFVSAEMIVAATRQTLEQNIYEVRIPLTQGQARHFASSASLLLPSRSPLSVVVGTIVSTDSEYRTPMDLGCVARLEIEF